MKVVLTTEDIEKLINTQIPNISKFNWKRETGEFIELEIEVPFDSITSEKTNSKPQIVTIKPEDNNIPKELLRELDKVNSLPEATGVVMGSGNRRLSKVF